MRQRKQRKKEEIMRKILLFIILLFQILAFTNEVRADVPVVSPSGTLRSEVGDKDTDFRVERLERFFGRYNSPLTPYAHDFVELADKYYLDYRLVPAISGVESTFGKRIPYKSYNAYGWANGTFIFQSWEHSIEVVSKTLREKYYDRGATDINKIARRYAPPSSTWGRNVKFFMDKIDPTPVEFDL